MSNRLYKNPSVVLLLLGAFFVVTVVFLRSVVLRDKSTVPSTYSESYYDSIQVVNDAAKDSNSSHIPY